MVKLEEFSMIKALFRQGYSKSEIARMLGIDRKTVRKYLNSNQIPEYRLKNPKPSVLDNYRAYLKSKISQADYTATRLFREIEAMGFKGSYWIVVRYVSKLKQEKHREAFQRFETLPGQQAQVDWTYIDKNYENGKLKKRYGFGFTLGYSRKKFFRFTTSCDIYNFLEAHIKAFEYMKGVPKEILYDNVKTVVLRREKDSRIIFHPKFLEFASHYGFIPRVCRPYRKETKGKIENAIGYMKRDFYLGRENSSITELNKEVIIWLDEVANKKRHASTQEVIEERAKRENLLPLPSVPYDTTITETRKVAKDCLFSYAGNKYSVPYNYAYKRIYLKIRDNAMKVYYQDKLIAEHRLSETKGKMIIDKRHYQGIFKPKTFPSLRIFKPEPISEVLPRSLRMIFGQRYLELKVEKRDLKEYEKIGKLHG